MLNDRDYRALLGAVEHLQEEVPLEELPRRMLAVVRRLVPCDHASYNRTRTADGSTVSHLDESDAYPRLAALMEQFNRLACQHPLVSFYTRCPDGALPVRKITDLMPQRRYRSLALYHDVYCHLDTEYQMVIALPGRQSLTALALNRKLKDFGEHDRRMLELVRPHLLAAQRRAMRRGLILAVLGDGSPGAAIDIIGRVCGELTAREAEVMYWMAQGKTNPQIGLILEASPRTIDKHAERILQKLQVESRTTAVARLIERVQSFQGPLPALSPLAQRQQPGAGAGAD